MTSGQNLGCDAPCASRRPPAASRSSPVLTADEVT